MRRFLGAVLVVIGAGLAGAAGAGEKSDPSGTWKWTSGSNRREVRLQLQREGDLLTGTMKGRDGQVMPVQDGHYQNAEVSFKVVGKTPDGQTITIRFRGTLAGDRIKGKSEIEYGGKKSMGNWEAMRSGE